MRPCGISLKSISTSLLALVSSLPLTASLEIILKPATICLMGLVTERAIRYAIAAMKMTAAMEMNNSFVLRAITPAKISSFGTTSTKEKLPVLMGS